MSSTVFRWDDHCARTIIVGILSIRCADIFLWLHSHHSRPQLWKMSCVSPANEPKRSRTRRTHRTRTTLGAKCGVAPGTC